VLNQLRQVNERRRQMMVQDKLLTANSMFQNMVSMHRFDFALTSQSMQAVLVRSRWGLRLVCLLPVVCEFLLSFFGEFMALYKQTEVSLSAWRPCCKGPGRNVGCSQPCT